MGKHRPMPLFTDDYMGDTSHLELAEHGAYVLLLIAMWRNKGSLPDDDRNNARLLGLQPRQWLRMKPRLMPFFEMYGPTGSQQMTQKRLQKVWNFSVENSRKQSEKGKLGAKARFERNQIFSSVRGNSHGNGRGSTVAATTASTVEQAQAVAQVKPTRKKDIITTSNSPATVAEEIVEKPAEDFPEMPANLNRLLQTNLMRRTS